MYNFTKKPAKGGSPPIENKIINKLADPKEDVFVKLAKSLK